MKKRSFLFTLLVFLLFALLSVSGAIQAEVFGVTEEHPFWVEGKGWTNAVDLSVGDAVSTLKSGALKVASIATDADTHTTYNFEVEDFHTYFVGDSALWVHYMCGGDGDAKAGIKELTDASGGTVKNAKKGDIRAPGGRERAKDLFREHDAAGVGNRKIVRERDGSRAVVGELEDGTSMRIRFKKNETTRIQAGKQKIQFND